MNKATTLYKISVEYCDSRNSFHLEETKIECYHEPNIRINIFTDSSAPEVILFSKINQKLLRYFDPTNVVTQLNWIIFRAMSGRRADIAQW